MPASETSATDLPVAKRRQQPRPDLVGIVLVVGVGPVDDAVTVEQHAGDAGVLAGEHVGAGKRFKRPQRDVAKIADRRCHQIERGIERARGNAGIVQPIAALPLPIRWSSDCLYAFPTCSFLIGDAG